MARRSLFIKTLHNQRLHDLLAWLSFINLDLAAVALFFRD